MRHKEVHVYAVLFHHGKILFQGPVLCGDNSRAVKFRG